MPDPGLVRQRTGATKISLTLESGRIKPIVGAQFAIGGPRAAIFKPKLTLGWAIVFTVVRSIGRAQLAVAFPLQLESIAPQPEPVVFPPTLRHAAQPFAGNATESGESLGVQ